MTAPSNPEANVPPANSALAVGFCAACGARLAVGARFCHRCGTPFGEGVPVAQTHATEPATASGAGSNLAAILPWGVAFVALLAIVANYAGKDFGGATDSPADGPSNALRTPAIDGGGPPTSAGGAPAGMGAPSIANLSPSERAARLYTRIIGYAEAGKTDSVSFFAPMAMASHEMLSAPTLAERFHYGRIAEVTGNPGVAAAQADTILRERPSHLLGLLLAARAARVTGDRNAERTYAQLLLRSTEKELATRNPDYTAHRAEIDRAVTEARALK